MKLKNYPCEILEEKINSTSVSIIGISHDSDFMFEHESFFKEKISQSDAILLECEPYFRDGFFNEIGRLAYSQGKKVYNADPMSKATGRLDRIQGGLGFGLALSAGLLGELYAIPVGLYFFLGSLSGAIVRYMPAGLLAVKKSTAPDPKNYYDILFYGETDYRNVMIAEGIDKISSEIKDIKKLACMHGAAHTRPIKAYLKNPALRKTKKLLYKVTYNLDSETKVREYTPDDMGWLLSKKF